MMMAGVEGVEGLGNVLECLYIYHPTKNTFQKPDLPLHIIKLYYMVGKRQLWVWVLLSYYLTWAKSSFGSRHKEATHQRLVCGFSFWVWVIGLRCL